LVATSSKPGFISNLFGTDRRLRPLVCALLYAALAFWLLSADWVLGPVLERVASALRVRGLSPGTVAFFETINLATALLLTWTSRDTSTEGSTRTVCRCARHSERGIGRALPSVSSMPERSHWA
jgi:hypothetical protein